MKILISTILFSIISLTLFVGSANAQNITTIENEYVKVRIDKRNGVIIGLQDKKRNWEMIRQPKLAMGLEMLLPLENRRNHKALSKDQVLSKIEKKSENEYLLVWDKIVGQEISDINIKAEALIKLEGEKLTFKLSIDNQSAYRIDEVWYPCFGGVRPPKDSKVFRTKTVNMCGGFQNRSMLNPFPQSRGYWGTHYPAFTNNFPTGGGMMPFELIELDGHGIYFGLLDQEYNIALFHHEFRPGFLDSKRNRIPEEDEISGLPTGYMISMVRTPFILPKESMELKPVVLEFYEGDWHQGVQPYVNWRKDWYKQEPQPKWIDTVQVWHTVQMLDPVGTISYTYKDLIDIAKEAKSNGVQALQIIGWSKDGQDAGYPYFATDPRLGTREEFKKVIQEIKDLGIHVLLFCKFLWADATIPEFEKEMKKFAQVSFHGVHQLGGFFNYQTLTGNNRAGAYLNHLMPEFREFAVDQLKGIIELGASGIQYDQVASGGYSFDNTGKTRFGESMCKGSLILAQLFYETAQKMNPDFVLTGEGPNDHFTKYYPVNYIRSSDHYYWLNKHVPVWKYINPDMKFATCLIGWDDREMINQSIAYGYIINYEPFNFKGKLSDIPETVAYGQKATALRTKLNDYLWEGEFKDTDGVELETVSGSDYYYSVFLNTKNNKKAIVITNNHVDEKIKVKIKSDIKKFSPHSADMIMEEIVTDTPKLYSINPRSLVVLVEE